MVQSAGVFLVTSALSARDFAAASRMLSRTINVVALRPDGSNFMVTSQTLKSAVPGGDGEDRG